MTDFSDPYFFKSYEYGITVHNRCLHHDVPIFNDFFSLIYSPLLQAVEWSARRLIASGKHRQFLEEACDEAVIHAVYQYKDFPEKYNPEKGKSLFRYLVMAAEADYRHEYDKEMRQTGNWDSLESVDNGDAESELDQYERQIPADVDIEALIEEGESRVWAEIRYHLPDARDQLCAYYMLDNVRETRVYVDIYDLHHLPPNEQDHVVKKHKDRIKKKLGRKLDSEDFRNHD